MDINSRLTELAQQARVQFNTSLTIEDRAEIPASLAIPKENNHWLRYEDVTCVYADMVKSTELSVTKAPQTVGKMYELFTGNVVNIMNHLFEADYIDVRGDGAFGLFVGRAGLYKAVAAAITIKTFIEFHARDIASTLGISTPLASHIGMQRGRLLAKRIGLRGDFQNEVWAGKPVNVAAKFAALGGSNELVTSKEVFDALGSDLLYKSCGCTRNKDGSATYTGAVKDTWEPPTPVEYSKYGTTSVYKLKTSWCPNHGDDYCRQILEL